MAESETTPFGREERLKRLPYKSAASRTKEEWIKINNGGRCFYCKVKMTRPSMLPNSHRPTDRSKDHFVPQSQGGRLTVPCCRRCNTMKGDMTVRRFMSLVAKHGFHGSDLWMACRTYFSKRDRTRNRLRETINVEA